MNRRSASVGALPHEKKHFVSRNESVSGISLDVRCACQYFQCDSLLPDRVNPVDSRPTSKLGFVDELGKVHELEYEPDLLHGDGHFQQQLPLQHQYQPMGQTLPFAPGGMSLSPTRQQVDQLSTHSFNVGGPFKPHSMEADRFSMRSVPGQGVHSPAPPVDLSFVEKYPELEEAARARGLVVHSISTEEETPRGRSTFMAGNRRRQPSIGGMSTGGRDPETLSMRSTTSIRRISRSPSKADLFVADINIPMTQATSAGPNDWIDRSRSVSRRASNTDIFSRNYVSPIMSPPLSSASGSPHRTFAASPPPATSVIDEQMELATPHRGMSPTPQDYRVAKPPPSVDYMRPEDNKENVPFQAYSGEMLPQNRPIDVSKYQGAAFSTPLSLTTSNVEPEPAIDLKTWNLPIDTVTSQQAQSTQPKSEIERQVNELETTMATHNVEDILDKIVVKTIQPPPSLAGDVDASSLHPGEDVRINIVCDIPIVDVDRLVQEETEKALERKMRQKSPSPQPREIISHHQQPPPSDPTTMFTLNTAQSSSTKNTESQLKRQYQDDNQNNGNAQHTIPKFSKTVMSDSTPTLQQPILTLTVATSDKDDSGSSQHSNGKTSSGYTSKIKSIFHLKHEDSPVHKEELQIETIKDMPRKLSNVFKRDRQHSPAPENFKSVTSKQSDPTMHKEDSYIGPLKEMPRKLSNVFRKDKGHSPVPVRLKSFMAKTEPTPMSIVSGVNTAVISRKSDKEPMSVKVTETFSLKVDDMDQYTSSRPPPPPPAEMPKTVNSSQNLYNSKDFMPSDRISTTKDLTEAFTPIVLAPSGSSAKFLAGNRTLYSSEINMQMRHSEAPETLSISSAVPSVNSFPAHIRKDGLISVPINIESNQYDSQSPVRDYPNNISQYTLRSTSSSSMERPKLPRKSSFSSRTQSQDRTRITSSSDNLFSSQIQMTKTVSFNFDERKSRLTDFENNPLLSKKQREHREFLDKTYFSRDHEYEPIGVPPDEKAVIVSNDQSPIVVESQSLLQEAEVLQKSLEDRYFSPAATITTTTTTLVESRSDYEIPAIQIEDPNTEELPLKAENGKRGFIASAQDRTRKMQAGFKTQAGKIKTKLRSPAKKAPSGSPKERERKRFKAPEFSKIKMPEIKRPDMSRFKDMKRPDMSKLKDFKRPEFTKFNKPDLSKFKLPEKLTTLKLRRSKSMKENENDEEVNPSINVAPASAGVQTQPKKIFDFNFGTYPRAFSRKKKQLEPQSSLGTEDPSSIIPSTNTQPSVESSNSPQGDRGPGPVRSRWADKFSDVSYNDSEGSRYRRYGSEQASSFDRESSLERQMKDDMEETEETGSEAPDLGIMRGVGDTKQFAEFDEENRAIHEISSLRAGEFKRRPLVHQDSDLRSEDSKEAEGWTEREIQKNKLRLKAELDAEASYPQRHGNSDDSALTQDAHSLASSGKKVVMEEIDEDEFFLRKRGVSEDNIELRQYISEAIREGYDVPMNSLKGVGSEPIEFTHEYDVPPPKPKRLNRDINYRTDNNSQDIGDELSMSQNGDYFEDIPVPPKPPTRKGRRSRSKQSVESQEINENFARVPYFDDDEEYLRPPKTNFKQIPDELNNLDAAGKRAYSLEPEDDEIDSIMSDQKYRQDERDLNNEAPLPEPPRRRKRQTRESSIEKDSYINGFGGRSVSNSYLQRPEDVIVYHTKHEYQEEPPLAAQERYDDDEHSFVSHKSRSRSPTRYPRHQNGLLSLDKSPSQSEMHPQETDSTHDKFIVDMLESDGYAIVRKDQPKPTPPARRKKFSRSPGERFATLPSSMPTPPPERPPPPRGYMPSPSSLASRDSTQPVPPRRKSALSMEDTSSSRIAYNEEDDYEEPEIQDERTDSPRNLQSGEVINRMKGRPLPPPPRPPRDKRQRSTSRRSDADEYDQQTDSEDQAYKQEEVEMSTQTDPLPDDFVCESFEITDDMKVIESRYKPSTKTLEELMSGESSTVANASALDDEQLVRGLQRFRDANQRSQSEKSRASSSLENRSKSHSRPQTPSAIVIERRVSTPVPSNQHSEAVLEASLTVQPLDDLELEEEALRREGLLSDSSQYSKEDLALEEDTNVSKHTASSTEYAPPSLLGQEIISSPIESELEETEREDDEVERTIHRDYGTTSEGEEQSEDVERYSTIEDEEELEYKRLLAELEAQEREEQEREQQIENEKLKALESLEIEAAATKRDEPISDFLKYDFNLQTNINKYQEEDVDEPQEQKVPSSIQLEESVAEEPPLPPPRRKSTTTTELPSIDTIDSTISTLATIAEQNALAEKPLVMPYSLLEATGHTDDLEVDRFRVNAVESDQILVSQLHGSQVNTDAFEGKSSNIVVKNIELPPNFIDDIVERVRSSEREHHHTIETQTSRQPSNEALLEDHETAVPPPKPPRHKDHEIPAVPTAQVTVVDAHTTAGTTPVVPSVGTSATGAVGAAFPPVFASTEYLQSIYSQLQQRASVEATDDTAKCQHHRRHHHHHHHHHYRRCSCSESSDGDEVISQHEQSDEDNEAATAAPVCRHRSRTRTRTRSRTRSRTHPPAEPPQSVMQAGSQFISACSLSLVKIINHLTASVRGHSGDLTNVADQNRQIPTLVMFFIAITFGLLIYLLSGRSVHTHHWDFFNPPGSAGRQS